MWSKIRVMAMTSLLSIWQIRTLSESCRLLGRLSEAKVLNMTSPLQPLRQMWPYGRSLVIFSLRVLVNPWLVSLCLITYIFIFLRSVIWWKSSTSRCFCAHIFYINTDNKAVLISHFVCFCRQTTGWGGNSYCKGVWKVSKSHDKDAN